MYGTIPDAIFSGVLLVECARHVDLKTRLTDHIKKRDTKKTRQDTKAASPQQINHFSLRDILTRYLILNPKIFCMSFDSTRCE